MIENYILGGIILTGIIAVIAAFWFYKRKRSNNSPEVQEFKFERKHYKFHTGLECWQEQMESEEAEKVAAILETLELSEFTKLDLVKLNKELFKEKGLRRIISIALKKTDGSCVSVDELGRLKCDEQEAVLNDFFTLNPLMRRILDSLKYAAVSQTIEGVMKRVGDLTTASKGHSHTTKSAKKTSRTG